MKLKYFLPVLLLLLSLSGFSQTGIECVTCKGMNGVHKTSCPYYNPPSKSSSSSTATSLESQIMGAIYMSLIQSVFSTEKTKAEPTAQEKAQAEKIDQDRQKYMALRQAKLKRYNDSIAEARHNKMMKDYKPLPGSKDLAYKGLDDKKKWVADVKFNCKITSFKGDVRIVNSDGSIRKLSLDNPVDLAPGDWIYTSRDSRLKLHYVFEDGGKDLIIGQNSFVNIITDENGKHLPKLVNGKTYITGKITEEAAAMANEEINSMKNALDDGLKKQKTELIKKFGRPALRTPTCALAVRGTTFSVSQDSINGTTLIVTDGAVDMTGLLMGNSITVEAGYKGTVKPSGEMTEPVKFEAAEIDKWWEE